MAELIQEEVHRRKVDEFLRQFRDRVAEKVRKTSLPPAVIEVVGLYMFIRQEHLAIPFPQLCQWCGVGPQSMSELCMCYVLTQPDPQPEVVLEFFLFGNSIGDPVASADRDWLATHPSKGAIINPRTKAAAALYFAYKKTGLYQGIKTVANSVHVGHDSLRQYLHRKK